jgi:hypothetical protein
MERFSFEEPLLDQEYHPTNKHEKCDMHSEGILQVEKANNVLQCEIHHDDRHYIYTQLKPLKVLRIRKEQFVDVQLPFR